MSRLSEAIEQIAFVRRYTLERLDTVPQSDWFTMPPEGVTHIAWQVGHIAMAEYRLCLERLDPRAAADKSLISDRFLAPFSRETTSIPASKYPPASEIRPVFDRVHVACSTSCRRTRNPIRSATAETAPKFCKRIASVRYASLHEMLHCGQIALIRRMFGQKPIW